MTPPLIIKTPDEPPTLDPAANSSTTKRPFSNEAVAAYAATLETIAIERDADLHARVVARLAEDGETIPAEEVFGPLDAEH